jgi:hypothetical protein
MAITRTTWVDDDGSGTVGTVVNNAEKTILYDQIDQASNRLNASVYTPVAAGTYAAYRPPGGDTAALWYLNATGVVDLLGIPAEPDLTQHLIINVGASYLNFWNQHAGAAAGNKIICPGYASSYSLLSWNAIWLVYSLGNQSWIVLKAS